MQSEAVDGRTNNDSLAAKSLQHEASSGSKSEPAHSLQNAQTAPIPKSEKSEKVVKKTAPSGGSSQPPRGNVVPMIITAGALAVAIGIGWWQAADH
jgi:hypothetical protein